MASPFINELKTFVFKKNIVDMGIAFLVSSYVNDFATNFVDIVVTPVLNSFFPQNKGILNLQIKILGMDFLIGKLIYLLIKFIIVFIAVFIVFSIIPEKI